MVRGIRIIPEINTPGHTASWSKAPQNSHISCALKENDVRGSLDVTLGQTYALLKEIFEEIFMLFPDPYVHLGGEMTVLACLSNLTQFL